MQLFFFFRDPEKVPWLKLLSHEIKFPDASNKFVISHAPGNDGGVLGRSAVLKGITSIKDSASFAILVSVWINSVKPKSCNINLNLQLWDLFKKLTLQSPRRIYSLRNNWDSRLRNTAINFECRNLDKSGGLYITKI